MFSTTTADTYTTIPSVHDHKNLQPTTVKIFPDSGASICLAGPHHLNQLKLTKNDLILCHKEVKAVGRTICLCHGWLPIKIIIGHIPPLNLSTSAIKLQQKRLSRHLYITTRIFLPMDIPPLTPTVTSLSPPTTSCLPAMLSLQYQCINKPSTTT